MKGITMRLGLDWSPEIIFEVNGLPVWAKTLMSARICFFTVYWEKP
jgi:hypothetical protein